MTEVEAQSKPLVCTVQLSEHLPVVCEKPFPRDE
jgi:hypothetical protein